MSESRALLVGAAPGGIDPALLADLAHAADLVIAVDGGAAGCLSAGLVPTFVIGDMDSLETGPLEAARAAGAEVIRFPAEKDLSDLDLALRFAASSGVESVAVTGVLCARVDHTLASAGSLCRSALSNVEIVETGLRGWLVVEQGPTLVLDGVQSTVSVMAVVEPALVSMTGFRWPLDHHRVQPASSLGLSNLITQAEATVQVHEGSVLVLSPEVGNTKPAARISRQGL